MAGVMLLLGWIKAPVRADAAVWNEKFQLEFLDYAAINENSQQSSLCPARIPSVLPALDSRQCCSNVRAEILDLTAAPRRDFAFQATVSRFSGNAFLADSVENPCLTPSNRTTPAAPYFASRINAGTRAAACQLAAAKMARKLGAQTPTRRCPGRRCPAFLRRRLQVFELRHAGRKRAINSELVIEFVDGRHGCSDGPRRARCIQALLR